MCTRRAEVKLKLKPFSGFLNSGRSLGIPGFGGQIGPVHEDGAARALAPPASLCQQALQQWKRQCAVGGAGLSWWLQIYQRFKTRAVVIASARGLAPKF